MLCMPDSGSHGEPEPLVEKGAEIHSAKAHRCVDKVGMKGHDTSSAWAICTASIGKRGVYAKGHGGNANPKTREADSLDAVAEELKEGWSDAARAAALCSRTQKPEHCQKARELVRKAAGPLVDKAKDALHRTATGIENKLGIKPLTDEERKDVTKGRAEAEELVKTLKDRSSGQADKAARDAKQRDALGIPFYKPVPETIRSRGQKRDLDAEINREYEHEMDHLSPRYTSGPNKGKKKKGWKLRFETGGEKIGGSPEAAMHPMKMNFSTYMRGKGR